MSHDDYCPTRFGGRCRCRLIADIRADEREKAAQRIDNKYTMRMLDLFGRSPDDVLQVYGECAQIVRQDGEQG